MNAVARDARGRFARVEHVQDGVAAAREAVTRTAATGTPVAAEDQQAGARPVAVAAQQEDTQVRVADVMTQIANNRMQHSNLSLALQSDQGEFVVTNVVTQDGQCRHICQQGGVGMRLRDIYATLATVGRELPVVMALPNGEVRELYSIREGQERGTRLEVRVTLGRNQAQAGVAAGTNAQPTAAGAATGDGTFTAQQIADVAESLGIGTEGGITVRHNGQDYAASGIIIGANNRWTIECGQQAGQGFPFERLSELIEESEQDILLVVQLPDGTTTPISGVFVGAGEQQGLRLTA